MNEMLTRMLILDEAVRDLPYEDSVGKLTIGVGWNLEKPMRHDEIMLRLKNDILEVEEQLNDFKWYTNMDEVRRLVLLDMCFNLGLTRLLGFKKMTAALMERDYDRAADEMESSKWAKQVGVRATRLISMMRSGEIHMDYMR